MKDRYKLEMDRLGPRQEKLDVLYEMIEGGTEMKQAKRLSRKTAAAILVCAVLTITAAAAAVPAVWETLQSQLGAFAPYAQTIDGAVCRDQGIEVQVLSALSDDLEARFYLSVRDVEGDRLNENLILRGQLEAEATPKEEWEEGQWIRAATAPNHSFKLLSYDPETKTALFSTSIWYVKEDEPGRNARLSLTEITTKSAKMTGTASCASITDQVLESLPVGERDQFIFKASDTDGLPYTDAVLPGKQVVLAPGQTPMPIEGNDDIRISSMGFASDGCFHVRLEFAEGVSVLDEEGSSWFLCTLSQTEKTAFEENAMWERLVPGGMDILFPLYKAEDLEQLQNGLVEFYGNYTRPGTAIAGDWNIDFQIEHHLSVTLDWTGELAGQQVEQVTLSPLSVTMRSIGPGGFNSVPLYAVKKDGSTVAAEPGRGSYSSRAIDADAGEPVWDAYNTWRFEEPVDLEELVCLTLKGERIPVD